jgi:hypothetical protein
LIGHVPDGGQGLVFGASFHGWLVGLRETRRFNLTI